MAGLSDGSSEGIEERCNAFAKVGGSPTRRRMLALVGVLYLLLFLMLTGPLVSRMTTHIATGDHPKPNVMPKY